MPVLATVFVALELGSLTPTALWNAHRSTPWLWMADILPILLGLLGRYLERPAPKGSHPHSLLLVLLVLLGLFPSAMMLQAWQETRISQQLLRATRLAGTLQTLTLSTYVKLNQKSSNNLRQDFKQIVSIRKEIKQIAPISLMAMESAWVAFYNEAIHSRKLSYSTALRMRRAAEKLTRSLEDEARASRIETAEILLVGVMGTLIALCLPLQLLDRLRQLETQLLVSSRQQTTASKQLELAHSQLEDTQRRLELVHTQLATTSVRDPLTGLHNHHALKEHFEAEWNRSMRYKEPLTVMLLTVDYFEAYKISFGAKESDAVLQIIGAVLHHGIRVSDFAARTDTEEFLVLLPHTREADAVLLAERLRVAIQIAPWKHRAVTVSIGLAERTSSMSQLADLQDAANVALFNAKKTHNSVCRSSGTAPSSGLKKAA